MTEAQGNCHKFVNSQKQKEKNAGAQVTLLFSKGPQPTG